MEHTLVQPESGSIVHLEVGDTLEVRLVEAGGAPWRTDLVPRGLALLWDSGRDPSRTVQVRTLVFRASFGAGGLVRLDCSRVGASPLDLCVTVSDPALSSR